MNNGVADTHANLATNEHIDMLVGWVSTAACERCLSQGCFAHLLCLPAVVQHERTGVRGLLDVHRPGDPSVCGDHCALFTRPPQRFNFSAPGLQGAGLRSGWERDLGWTLDKAMPAIKSGAVVGVFLCAPQPISLATSFCGGRRQSHAKCVPL